jgi:hypothetical protein
MTPQKIIEFIKINGGAATALLLSFMYINKLETRLEKVESQLHDCYTRNYAVSDFNNYNMPLPSQIIAILPKETKIESYGKRKNQKVA